MEKCDRCGKYEEYTRNGLCKECFWNKHINECKEAENTLVFYEYIDTCYGC